MRHKGVAVAMETLRFANHPSILSAPENTILSRVPSLALEKEEKGQKEEKTKRAGAGKGLKECRDAQGERQRRIKA